MVCFPDYTNICIFFSLLSLKGGIKFMGNESTLDLSKSLNFIYCVITKTKYCFLKIMAID